MSDGEIEFTGTAPEALDANFIEIAARNMAEMARRGAEERLWAIAERYPHTDVKAVTARALEIVRGWK